MPYDDALTAVGNSCRSLKVVDLDGILNFGAFKYCLTYRAVNALQRKGVSVKLGKQTDW